MLNLCRSLLLVALCACGSGALSPALAQDQQILVTVNDKPITSFDVEQRINLWKLLGQRSDAAGVRKQALNSLIDDIATIEEAKKYQAEATEKEIDARLANVAKGLNTDANGLQDKLREQGISVSAMRQYVAAQIAMTRLLRGKYKDEVKVKPEEVDQKLAEITADINGRMQKIKADPRMQAVTVYELLEVRFPVESGAEGMSDEMLKSRFVEATQFVSRFKGCKSARSAASGIFNVKIGKVQQADGRKIPAQMKTAFSKNGVGSAIGPFRTQQGIQVWGFCGTKKITPELPKAQFPTREQVEKAVINEKYSVVEEKYLGIIRKSLMIEYRDPAFTE